MSITTILPSSGTRSFATLKEDVLACLKRQPEIPLSMEAISGNIVGVTEAEVKQAVEDIEGPVIEKCRVADAYVHLCRCNNVAVYIP